MDIDTYMTDYIPRKKKINSGRYCGPCVLCGQTSYQYYAHPIHWSFRLRENFLDLEDIDVNNCICWKCEKAIFISTIHQICYAGKRECFCQGLYSSNRFLYFQHYNTNICIAIEVATNDLIC